ncbi:hypothetical protein SKAU_G00422930 [Synaphobranchus kaupii]|uniref:Uncharacterized protein n=1 Tax=Synaphobranchus kaupii TaxID=118154 RepID=A0A9Q1IAI9_SYNKA|nr:hypothetical protein SKAU_G00422930 [Synaphobranchus kaupii]
MVADSVFSCGHMSITSYSMSARTHLRRNALLCGIVHKFQCKPASRADCTVLKGELRQLRQPAVKTCLDCRESFCTWRIDPSADVLLCGWPLLSEAVNAVKDSLSNLQQGYVGFMDRIKLFLQVEEKAWQKRFSVAMVMESRKLKDRIGKMKEVEHRLQEMERTLQEAQAIQDPLTLLQI